VSPLDVINNKLSPQRRNYSSIKEPSFSMNKDKPEIPVSNKAKTSK